MYDPTVQFTGDLLERLKSTWKTPHVEVFKKDVWREFFRPNVIKKQSTDGIGTKGVYHWEKKSFEYATQDFLAMNLNDLAVMRATPYLLTDHITMPQEDHNSIFRIIDYLVKECSERNIAIPGGETSFHSTMNELEISGTVLGFSSSSQQYKNTFREGDLLIGLRSSGLHSNGYSKIRDLFPDEVREEFVQPTTIYSDQILDMLKTFGDQVSSMVHITGGAFTNLLEPLGKDVDANLDLSKVNDKLFEEIYGEGVTDHDMYKIFNCGVGYVLAVKEGYIPKILNLLDNSMIIGNISSGRGNVKIESAFSDNTIIY